ncbi:MAG: histidine kinase [Holophagales bacterium]|nr:MAG: histidine kinase [Holophagales bacterium]
MSPPTWAEAARWALVWLGLGVFFASRLVTAGAVDATPVAWSEALALCVPYWAIWGMLALVVVRLGRALPLGRPVRPARWLAHVGAAVVFALVHAAAMLALASLRAAAAGEGATDFFSAASWGAELRADFHFDVLTYLFVLVAHLRMERRRELARREVQTSRLAEQLAEARLAALRMQLHPHFLFNTLNSIAELLRLDVAAAGTMVQRLAGLLRAALATASDPETSLGEELALVERYLDIERVRFGDRLVIVFDSESGLADAAVPGLVLQPLVENAMRHGLARRSRLGHLRIAARRAGAGLELSVENDGPDEGAGPSGGGSARPSSGLGLANTRSRLAELYGDAARCVVESSPERYRVRLELPLRRRETRPAPPCPAEVSWNRA